MFKVVIFDNSIKAKVDSIQKRVDAEVLRYMDPYIPYQSGVLAKSAVINTVIGSGEVRQVTPYARYLYYGEVYGPNIPIVKNGEVAGFYSPPQKFPTGRELTYDTGKHPLAGKMWFERMKADHKNDILREVMK